MFILTLLNFTQYEISVKFTLLFNKPKPMFFNSHFELSRTDFFKSNNLLCSTILIHNSNIVSYQLFKNSDQLEIVELIRHLYVIIRIDTDSISAAIVVFSPPPPPPLHVLVGTIVFFTDMNIIWHFSLTKSKGTGRNFGQTMIRQIISKHGRSRISQINVRF